MFEEVNVNDLASALDFSLFHSAASIPAQPDRENDTKGLAAWLYGRKRLERNKVREIRF